jgi:hypothetical protein
MKTKHFLIMAIAGVSIFSGCKKEYPWEIIDKDIRVSHFFTSCSIHVQYTDLSISIVVDAAAADWCTLSGIKYGNYRAKDGSLDVLILFDITPNLIAEQRVALVTVSKDGRSEVVTITQYAGDATLSIDHTMIELEYTASTYAIPVTSNASWTATVDPAATWCTLVSASGKRNGTITVSTPEAVFKRYTTVFVQAGTLRDSVTVFQNALPNNSSGVEIDGIIWAIRNVDDFGTFAPLAPQEPNQLLGKLYQYNRPVAYTATDPLYPAWDDTYPEPGEWSLLNDPCPGGWRVASVAEYRSLEASGWRWMTAAESEFGIPGTWFGPGAQNVPHSPTATDAVFFPAAGARIMPDGHHLTAEDKMYQWEGDNGCYWSTDTRYLPMLFGIGVDTGRTVIWNKCNALSIRCVKQ